MKRNILILILMTSLLLSACGTASPASVQATEPATATEIAPTQEAAPSSDSAPAAEPTQEPTPEKMTFTDDLGNTIELDGYPKSIVSISASTTEILFAIGAGDQVVGRDEYSVYPDAALNVPSVGAMWEELPTEAILALEPDLVVAAQIISEDQVQTLRDLGLNVYWQANPTSYEGLWENLRAIAQMTGHEAEAESLIADLDARLTTVQDKVATVSSRPSTFYELDATDPSNPWTDGLRHLYRLHHFPGGWNQRRLRVAR